MSEAIVGQIWSYPSMSIPDKDNYYLVLAYHGVEENWHQYTLYDLQQKKELEYALRDVIEKHGTWRQA